VTSVLSVTVLSNIVLVLLSNLHDILQCLYDLKIQNIRANDAHLFIGHRQKLSLDVNRRYKSLRVLTTR